MGMFSTMKGYDICRGCLEYHGVFSTMEGYYDTCGGYYDTCGGYHEYHGGVQHCGGTQITKETSPPPQY